MNTRTHHYRAQSGFHVIELGLVIVALALIGSIGYLAYTNFIVNPEDKPTLASIPKPTDVTNVAQLQIATEDVDRL